MKEDDDPKFYRPAQMPALLGVSRSTYYKIVRDGHLPYSRLYLGGPRVHLREHIEAYREYLLSQTKGGKGP